jgi:glucokinase
LIAPENRYTVFLIPLREPDTTHMAMKFPFPVLLSDIGGTNVRFALAKAPGLALEHGPHMKTADHPSLEAAIEASRAFFSAVPRSMIACAAGPIDGRKVKMTNAAWSIDGATVAAAAKLDQGLLLNDFEAQALSLAALPAASTQWIGDRRDGIGPQLVLGPGTGLGVSLLLNIDQKFVALPSEAGHVEFGATNLEEALIWSKMAGPPFRVTAEALLSGPGLVRLHFARLAALGKEPPSLDEVSVVAQAHAHQQGEEAATLRLFWNLIGRFAGDMALAFLAKGGVTFAGGVLPKITAFLDETEFRRHFENKAPYVALMQKIGTRLIIAADSVLDGMAAIAASPEHYALDEERRAWVQA